MAVSVKLFQPCNTAPRYLFCTQKKSRQSTTLHNDLPIRFWFVKRQYTGTVPGAQRPSVEPLTNSELVDTAFMVFTLTEKEFDGLGYAWRADEKIMKPLSIGVCSCAFVVCKAMLFRKFP